MKLSSPHASAARARLSVICLCVCVCSVGPACLLWSRSLTNAALSALRLSRTLMTSQGRPRDNIDMLYFHLESSSTAGTGAHTHTITETACFAWNQQSCIRFAATTAKIMLPSCASCGVIITTSFLVGNRETQIILILEFTSWEAINFKHGGAEKFLCI